ncbi:hypothetical protein HG537_0B06130 [Torulaspora globosa]|uniref:Probable electron transfer flavoprotein subunit alpha n=1 Tax=Torulaspora globosa TaxID=48254 RepID=A0A7H9HSB3_9SACH|nr:hypothetical protein HG537_0B06130 [Torulaspora sp. CBS 2947]
MIRFASRNLKTFGLRVHRSRLASTLAFVETTKEGTILPSSLSALNAAQQLGNNITALLLGPQATAAASVLKSSVQCTKLNKVLVSDEVKYEHYLPEKVTPLLVDLLKDEEYSHFVVASSAVGKNLLPRVAALLDYQPVCDITKINDAKTFVRPIYAGNVIETVENTQPKALVSVRASAFEAVPEGTSESAVIEQISFSEGSTGLDIQWQSANLVKSARPDLSSASTIVAGGRALKDKETFDKLLVPLADALGAGIGATRAAVDSGFCDNSLQIGQTGKVVAPDLYIAIGISGAIQHLAGMKDSKKIVAINSDPDAPILKVADYSLEGDLFEIVPQLTEKLTQASK